VLPTAPVLVGTSLVVGLFVPVSAVFAFALLFSIAMAVAHSLVRGLLTAGGLVGEEET
jgi:predicted membrane-bound spermidine synthase